MCPKFDIISPVEIFLKLNMTRIATDLGFQDGATREERADVAVQHLVCMVSIFGLYNFNC